MERSQSSRNPKRHDSNSACGGGDKLLDTGKNEGKAEVDNITETPISYDTLRAELQSTTQESLARIDNLLKSRWIWGDKKWYLKMFRALIADSAHQLMVIMSLNEQMDNQYEINANYLEILRKFGKEIGNLKGTTKEIQDLKAKMDELLNSPEVQEIHNAIQNMRKVAEKRDRNREKILRDSIV
jgi:hypothetical protein